jgi:hypothetical protein
MSCIIQETARTLCRSRMRSHSPEVCATIAPPGRHRRLKMRLLMHKITPLNGLILAAAKQGQSPPQFVIKTRVCVAISTDARNGLRRNLISMKSVGITLSNASIRMKPTPPAGAIADHPEIKNLQRRPSHAWPSTQAKPTTGSR